MSCSHITHELSLQLLLTTGFVDSTNIMTVYNTSRLDSLGAITAYTCIIVIWITKTLLFAVEAFMTIGRNNLAKYKCMLLETLVSAGNVGGIMKLVYHVFVLGTGNSVFVMLT